MDITHLTVEVRDRNLNRIGQIPISDLSLTITDEFRNVGSWTVSLPSESGLAAILRQPGSGIIVTLEDGSPLLSGPAVKAEDAATVTDPNGTLTVDGITDTALLADRLCFPDPANLDPANQTATHDVRTGTCEDLMFAYVNANIGPSAPTSSDPNLGSRRDTRLQLGTNSHRGPSVTKRARFDVLGDLLADLAATAGIGFRVVQVANHLEFQTFAVTDRSQSIRLDIFNNMLAGHRVAVAPPSVTRAIVAGQDIERDPSETDQEWAFERQFVAVSTPDSRQGESDWGRRIEVFVDKRQEDGSGELVQAGEEALQDGGFSQISVQVVPMEDFFSNFGVDWHLGDHLTVVVQGVEMQADITGYVLRYDANGFKMGVTLGDPVTLDRSPAITVQTLDSRVSSLERNTATTTAVNAAANAGPVPLSVTSFNQSTPAADYPPGESLIWLTASDATAGGWDFGGMSGVVSSMQANPGDVVQTWQRAGTSAPELWMRQGNGSGWGPWKRLYGLDSLPSAQQIVWGGDTNLYRSAASVLKTDDSLAVGQDLAVTGNLAVTGDLTVAGSLAVAGIGSRITKVKSANESAPNTTRKSDGHLFWSVVANATYTFDLNLVYSGADGNNAGELGVAWTQPSGSKLTWGVIGQAWYVAFATTGDVNTQAVVDDGTSPSLPCLLGTSSSPMLGVLRGTLYTTGSPGTLQLQWWQWVGNATPSTVYKGSSGSLERVA